MLPFLDRLFLNPETDTTAAYSAAANWAAQATTQHSVSLDDLLLQLANQRYDDQRQALATLESKLSELLRFDGAIAVGLFAIVRITGTKPGVWFVLSFLLLTLAMCLCVFARRAFSRPVRASIRSVLDGIHFAERPKVWLARSLHLVVVALDDTSSRAAARLNVASYLTALSMISLFIALLTMALSADPAVVAAAS